MVKVGIIGHAAEKFTSPTEALARFTINNIVESYASDLAVVSGRSPMGGIDVWAEEIANKRGLPTFIYPPRHNHWGGSGGYKERNLRIAQTSDVVYVIVVEEYPPDYQGMVFDGCYHCLIARPPHIKSGACWTAIQAEKLGKQTHWVIL